ncbi:MAG: hypothetical protein O2816_09625 [Planctomycetota bacterium]|nr:hypothetical protein [Planctomycetota bacterium]
MRISRLPAAGLAFGVAVLLCAPAAAQCPGTEDSFEDNDDCSTPWLLAAGNYPGLYTELEVADQDYFQFSVPAGMTLAATADFIDAGGDLDLRLWDVGCLTQLDGSFSVTDQEAVTYINNTGASVDVVLQAYIWSGDPNGCNVYDLDVQVVTNACPGTDDAFEDNDDCSTPWLLSAGSYPGLYTEMNTLDPDYFQISVPANNRVDVTVTLNPALADIDIELFDLGCSTSLDLASTANGVEVASWVNTTGGSFDVVANVHVWAFAGSTCGDYSMDISIYPDPCLTGADDGLEDNDDCGSAITGVNGSNPGLFVSKYDLDYYAYTLNDGDSIDVNAFFAHANGDVDIILYDAGVCGGGLGSGLTQGSSVTDDEVLTYTNATGGVQSVVLEVNIWSNSAFDCNSYDLDVAVNGGQGPIGTSYCGPANLNSSGGPALISAFGLTSVANNDVRLDAAGMATSQFGYFINGTVQGFVLPPGSQGNLCLSGGIGRHNANVLNSGATGEFSLQLNLNLVPTPGGDVAINPGETWYWQAWFRDVNPGNTSNFTDGICITFS